MSCEEVSHQNHCSYLISEASQFWFKAKRTKARFLEQPFKIRRTVSRTNGQKQYRAFVKTSLWSIEPIPGNSISNFVAPGTIIAMHPFRVTVLHPVMAPQGLPSKEMMCCCKLLVFLSQLTIRKIGNFLISNTFSQFSRFYNLLDPC